MPTPRLPAAALAAALLLPAAAPAAAPGQAGPAMAPSHASPAAPVAPPAGARTPSPEFTAAVVAYPITLERVEHYARAVKALREAAEKDAAVQAELKQPRRKGATLAAAAAQLDAMPATRAILAREGLSGRDFLLIPQVVLSSRSARIAEKEGRTAPAGRVNPAGLALHRTHWDQLDSLTMSFMADVKAIGAR